MVKRFLTWMLVFSFVLSVMPPDPRAAEEADGEGPLLREVVWQITLKTLQGHGFVIYWSSIEEGQIITEFMPLALDTLLASVSLPAQGPEQQWTDAAYRYKV